MISIDIKASNQILLKSLTNLGLNNIQGTVVYTAIFGNFDTLNEVRHPKSTVNYICFTDQADLTSDTWLIVQCRDMNNDSRLFAKVFKVFPHKIFKNANRSLWIDGNYLIKKNHWKFLDSHENVSHIKFYRHSLRACIYDEAKVLKSDKPEFDPESITKQMNRYMNENMPSMQGLINGAIILRNHASPLLPKLMDDWWYEIYNYSIRDQLSFNYVDWKNGSIAEYFSENITDFTYFSYRPHLVMGKDSRWLRIKFLIRSFIGSAIGYVRNKR